MSNKIVVAFLVHFQNSQVLPCHYQTFDLYSFNMNAPWITVSFENIHDFLSYLSSKAKDFYKFGKTFNIFLTSLLISFLADKFPEFHQV